MENYPPCVNGAKLAAALHALPSSHPACNQGSLTPLQQAYLPALLWLFDTNRYRAQGRSYLLAYVAVELAMRGEDVTLDDFSMEMTQGRRYSRQAQGSFVNTVMTIAHRAFPGHRFDFDQRDHVLRYRGRHPR